MTVGEIYKVERYDGHGRLWEAKGYSERAPCADAAHGRFAWPGSTV